MIDFSLFDKALKITWVKCLCSNDNGPWKFILLSLLLNVGGKLLFQCNYDIKYLCINEQKKKTKTKTKTKKKQRTPRLKVSKHKNLMSFPIWKQTPHSLANYYPSLNLSWRVNDLDTKTVQSPCHAIPAKGSRIHVNEAQRLHRKEQLTEKRTQEPIPEMIKM